MILRSRDVLVFFILSGALGLPCASDEITIDGTLYRDVYIRTSESLYFVQMPEDGSVLTVSRASVPAESVVITEDPAARGAILERWKVQKALREGREGERARRVKEADQVSFYAGLPTLEETLGEASGQVTLTETWRDDRERLHLARVNVTLVPEAHANDEAMIAARKKRFLEELELLKTPDWSAEIWLTALGVRLSSPIMVRLEDTLDFDFYARSDDKIAVVYTRELDLSAMETPTALTDSKAIAETYPLQLALFEAMARTGKAQAPYQIASARVLVDGFVLFEGTLDGGTWELTVSPEVEERIFVYYEFSTHYGAGDRGVFEKKVDQWTLTRWEPVWIS